MPRSLILLTPPTGTPYTCGSINSLNAQVHIVRWKDYANCENIRRRTSDAYKGLVPSGESLLILSCPVSLILSLSISFSPIPMRPAISNPQQLTTMRAYSQFLSRARVSLTFGLGETCFVGSVHSAAFVIHSSTSETVYISNSALLSYSALNAT